MTASKIASGTTATVKTVSNRFASQFSLSDLTAKYLKDNYLTGFTFLGSDGQELPPTFYEEKIAVAISKLEGITHIDILQREVCGERHDYIITDYLNYAFMQLYRLPALTVREVRIVYPTGQTIQAFPSDWTKVMVEHGQLHLMPASGNLASVMIGGGVGFLPALFAGSSFVPQLWEVDYTSGFAENAVPRDIVSAICKMAAIEVLTLMSDLIGPLGIASSSLGIDGMSQSVSRQLPAFKARIDQYKTDLGLPGPGLGVDPKYTTGEIGQLRRTYLGMVMASV